LTSLPLDRYADAMREIIGRYVDIIVTLGQEIAQWSSLAASRTVPTIALDGSDE
jgi:hypothetical protein